MKVTPWFVNFDFNGRSRRAHYWANVGCWFAAWVVLWLVAGMLGLADGGSGAGFGLGMLLLLAAGVASVVDSVAMVFRRAHDTGKSGWIWLLLLVPFVNLLALYWLLIEDSQQGPNKYGPPVKTFYAPAVA
jgi:uncharacterized membrane protein YhaH (DUF805 family)